MHRDLLTAPDVAELIADQFGELAGSTVTGPPVIVDTSALVSVAFGESDSALFRAAMVAGIGSSAISAVNAVEASTVIEGRQGNGGTDDLDRLYRTVALRIVPVDAAQADLAILAWRRFGKGRHPAALNLGDCFSYALTKATGGALLYKGNDFTQTDVVSAR